MKNRYEIRDNYVVIFLDRRNGDVFETYIDLEDLPKIIDYKYKFVAKYNINTNSYCAYASEYTGKKNKNGNYNSNIIILHRVIMDFPDCEVDHINHNTLDNRKNNLRLIETSNNGKNRKGKNKNNKSGYRNVCWIKKYNKWCVQLQINGRNTLLGKFDDVHEAGKYAEEMREKYYGEYAGNN